MAIHAVLVINQSGKPRLTKFYTPTCSATHVRTQLVSQIFSAVQDRPDSLCNFVDLPASEALGGPSRVVYRHYATLYFIFLVDEAESELGILDLIQVCRSRTIMFVAHSTPCYRSLSNLWTDVLRTSAS